VRFNSVVAGHKVGDGPFHNHLMPTLSAPDLEVLATSPDATTRQLAGELIRYRLTLARLRGLLGIYSPANVRKAWRLVTEEIGEA
jgi:hypothetical protein